MNKNFHFHNINELENMMINILSEGCPAVWQGIDKEKDAIKRCHIRNVFWQAQAKIENGK